MVHFLYFGMEAIAEISYLCVGRGNSDAVISKNGNNDLRVSTVCNIFKCF